MIKRKTDTFETTDTEVRINGELAILTDTQRQVLIVAPGNWSKFWISQVNEFLDHHFASDWFLAVRDGEHRAIRHQRRNDWTTVPEGLGVALPRMRTPEGADLTGKDLPPVICYLAWWHCRLDRVTFRQSRFMPTRNFIDCSMQEIQFVAGCSLQGVIFDTCNLEAANFGDSRLTDVHFANCHLEGANFADCLFGDNVRFIDCVLTSATMPRSPLSQVPEIDEIPF